MTGTVAPAGESAIGGVLRLGPHAFPPGRPLIMAIVNRTPDSFFQPGVTWAEAAAVERVHQAVAEGADIIDVGGMPAAPGADVDAGEEIRRTAGFIAAVRSSYPDGDDDPFGVAYLVASLSVA